MTRKEFDQSTELTDFCKVCLENEYHGKEIYRELWKQAKDIDEFKTLVKNDERVKLKQGTAELLKGDWYYLRSILGDNQFKTMSDAGGVKVGNDTFSVVIPNGEGDGETRVAILEQNENNNSAFNFFTSLEGEFNIYNYDCGNDVVKTLTGRYGAYYGNGFVVFEKWDK